MTNTKDKEQNKANIELNFERSKGAQIAKANDKERANEDPKFRSITLALQSVLQIPSFDVSLMCTTKGNCAVTTLQSTNLRSQTMHTVFCGRKSRGSVEVMKLTVACVVKNLQDFPERIEELQCFLTHAGVTIGTKTPQHYSTLCQQLAIWRS